MMQGMGIQCMTNARHVFRGEDEVPPNLGMPAASHASLEAVYLPGSDAVDSNPVLKEMLSGEVSRFAEARGIAIGDAIPAYYGGDLHEARTLFLAAVAIDDGCADGHIGVVATDESMSTEERVAYLADAVKKCEASYIEESGARPDRRGRIVGQQWSFHPVRALSRVWQSYMLALEAARRYEEACDAGLAAYELLCTGHTTITVHVGGLLLLCGRLRRHKELEDGMGPDLEAGDHWLRVLRYAIQRKFKGALKAYNVAAPLCPPMEEYICHEDIELPPPPADSYSKGTESELAKDGYAVRRAWYHYPYAIEWLRGVHEQKHADFD